MKSARVSQSSSHSRSSSDKTTGEKKRRENSGFEDKRSENSAQKELNRIANESEVVNRQKTYQQMADAVPAQFVKNDPVTNDLRTPHVKFPKGRKSNFKRRREREQERRDAREWATEVENALELITDASKQHIMVEKHAWKRIFPGHEDSDEQEGTHSEVSWELVKGAIKETMIKGSYATLAGSAYISRFRIYGELVEVTYADTPAGTRIGDAWVKTREYGAARRAGR